MAAPHRLFNAFSNGNSIAAQAGAKGIYKFSGNYLTSGQIAGQIASHAAAGGVISELAGGKFGHGFVAAGFTKGAMGSAGFNCNNTNADAIIERTIIAAMVGGSVSELTVCDS